MEERREGVIIAAYPCLGKSTYVKENPYTSIDLEISDFMYVKDGFEHLSVEEFKGLSGRIPNEESPHNYINAIISSIRKYKYVFISCHSKIIKPLLEKGFKVHLVRPFNNEGTVEVMCNRSINRGNNEAYVRSVEVMVRSDTLKLYSDSNLSNLIIHYIPNHYFISDFIRDMESFTAPF